MGFVFQLQEDLGKYIGWQVVDDQIDDGRQIDR